MENEVRDIVKLAVSLILVSIVIMFIAYCATLMSGMSADRNEQIQAQDRLAQFREYNAYDKKTLIGDEVIELIRLKYDSGITIFVDTRTNQSNNAVVDANSGRTCASCQGKGGDHRKFNKDLYILHSEKDINGNDNSYFNISYDAIKTVKNDLRNWFPTAAGYATFLVYNSQDTEAAYKSAVDSFTIKAQGVSGRENRLNVLWDCLPEKLAGSEVTGVVLVKLTTLGIAK